MDEKSEEGKAAFSQEKVILGNHLVAQVNVHYFDTQLVTN